jgi:dimethylhistidine N-methyltransferase
MTTAVDPRFTDTRFTVVRLTTGDDVTGAFADDVRAGLAARPKALPPKYFYDALGSHLFEAICNLPEYYLTAAEEEILAHESAAIADALGAPVTVIELGSGSSAKTPHLLSALLARQRALHYLPIDIAAGVLERSSRELVQAYDRLHVTAYASDFRSALAHLADAGVDRGDGERVVVLFLGSTIGNLEPEASREFLGRVRRILAPGDALLLGADLKKSADVLIAAYDDPLGVTAAFNLNVLARINRELGGAFDVRRFRHRATYDADAGRVEMHLVSDSAQTVAIRGLGMTVTFEEGESIHTESSHKYDRDQLAELARDSGFALERTWLDAQERFSLNLFAAV